MPTIKQLIRKTRQPIRNVTKSPALRGCPQRRGTCTRVYARLVDINVNDQTHHCVDVEEKKINMAYRNRKRKTIRYLKIKIYHILLLGINLWFPLVQIQSPRFEVRRNSPSVAKVIH
ncbi:hypothetical protein QJS04_geneDACA022070 [Acorus gramineus]|uniref:Ribosomal protein S12 n=1 Tax=Acorus gramineus TaxID=55184 RepID=A0AAV9A379_ACOGR|nr:hypothetical protein QJS04_geneDACA022070 [Acorus gramineus]